MTVSEPLATMELQPLKQYGVTIQRGYCNLGLPSYPKQLARPTHDPPQRYNQTPMESSYFMTLFLDALHGLPTLDANGDDCDTPPTSCISLTPLTHTRNANAERSRKQSAPFAADALYGCARGWGQCVRLPGNHVGIPTL